MWTHNQGSCIHILSTIDNTDIKLWKGIVDWMIRFLWSFKIKHTFEACFSYSWLKTWWHNISKKWMFSVFLLVERCMVTIDLAVSDCDIKMKANHRIKKETNTGPNINCSIVSNGSSTEHQWLLPKLTGKKSLYQLPIVENKHQWLIQCRNCSTSVHHHK